LSRIYHSEISKVLGWFGVETAADFDLKVLYHHVDPELPIERLEQVIEAAKSESDWYHLGRRVQLIRRDNSTFRTVDGHIGWGRLERTKGTMFAYFWLPDASNAKEDREPFIYLLARV